MAMRNRRLALAGLAKILDAGALEELFTCPDDEAVFLYDLLVDTARARSSAHYADICRTARRRGVTPDYVVDRAVVLLGAMAERRRMDLYRILGVAPAAIRDGSHALLERRTPAAEPRSARPALRRHGRHRDDPLPARGGPGARRACRARRAPRRGRPDDRHPRRLAGPARLGRGA